MVGEVLGCLIDLSPPAGAFLPQCGADRVGCLRHDGCRKQMSDRGQDVQHVRLELLTGLHLCLEAPVPDFKQGETYRPATTRVSKEVTIEISAVIPPRASSQA